MEKSFLLVLPLLGVVLIGYLAVRLRWLGQAVSDGVARFTLALAVPLMVFHTLATNRLPRSTANIWELVGSYYGGVLLVFALAMVVARFAFRLSPAQQSSYASHATHSNVVMLGLPAVILVLGSQWTTTMILVASHGLVLALLGTAADGLARGQRGDLPRRLWKDVVTEIRQPIFMALVAGLIANQIQVKLPGPLDHLAGAMAGAAVPCALFAVGGMLARLSISRITRQTAAIHALKLAVLPLVVWIIASFVASIPASWTWIAVMLAIMPITLDVSSDDGEFDYPTAALSTLLGGAALFVLTLIIVVA